MPVRSVQRTLLEQGGYLLPYLDVEKGDPLFLPLQRIGATGILQGVGRNEGWANQTWFRAADTLVWNDLNGLKEAYPGIDLPASEEAVTLNDCLKLTRKIAGDDTDPTSRAKEMYDWFGFGSFEPGKPLTRAQAAVLIDGLLNSFDREVDIKGNYID